MDPLTMAVIGAPIVGGLAQYLGSQGASQASAAERARIQALLDKVQDPNFDMSQFTPEEYQIVGKVAPQALQYIQEAAPQLVQQSAAGQQGQDAMLGALQRLRGIGQTGADAQSGAMVDQAMRQSQIQNQGQQSSIVDSMARRGGAPGSGLEFAAALSAQQGNNQAGATAGTNAALSAYQTRLQALKDSANIGGQVQQNDINMQSQNAGIINGFNQRMAAGRNANAAYNTTNVNDAQRTNLGVAQNTADQNVGLRNNAVKEKNNLAQTQYQNALDKVRINAGLSAGNQTAIAQNAQNQNNAIQGATTGISSGLLYAGSQKADPYAETDPLKLKYNNQNPNGRVA